LKLKYEELLSNFGFKFYFRRYNEGVILQIDLDRDPRHAHLHDDVAYVKARTTTYCPPATSSLSNAFRSLVA